MNKALLLMVVLAACLFSPSSALAQGETIETRVGELSFTHDFANGYPSKETVKLLFDEMDFQRACQAYIWGIPIVAFAEWQHAHEETFGLRSGEILYYPTYASKLGLLTANATTPYALSFIWSFTMYRLPERWLVDNPIDRYSIGSSTEGLKKNEDGSLTIYISKDSPGKDKESNWLPAPDGPFWVVLRTYGPSKEILDKTWKQPPYQPMK